MILDCRFAEKPPAKTLFMHSMRQNRAELPQLYSLKTKSKILNLPGKLFFSGFAASFRHPGDSSKKRIFIFKEQVLFMLRKHFSRA